MVLIFIFPTPSPLNVQLRLVTLVPCASLADQLHQMKLDPDETFKYLLANLLILAPLPALLMAILGTRIHLWIVLLGALILSGGIEVLQYTMWTYRVADVDDVIMNVGGA